MSKPSKSRKEKVPKITEEQYAQYISSLREDTPAVKPATQNAENKQKPN